MAKTKRPPAPNKAYRNKKFLQGPEARSIRILSEYLEPESRFEDAHISDTIVFFGSARTLPPEDAEARLAAARKKGKGVREAEMALEMSRYYEETRQLAYRLTEWSKNLEDKDHRFVVCSGGGGGIMEAANRGASEAKGETIGLNISLPFEQEENPYITHRLCFEFHYFFMRKFWFAYLAKAMVVMPGGFGTLDEMLEVLTLRQTGKIDRPLPIVLFGAEYWKKVVNFEALVEHGTVSKDDLALLWPTDSVDEAFDYFTAQLTEHALGAPGGSLG